MNITIRRLAELDPVALRYLVSGYVADTCYQVQWGESAALTTFHLELVALAQPYIKQYDYLDDETLARYCAVVQAGYCWGAYTLEQQVGVLLAEPHWWNASLWVWEFHVAESHRRQGIGQRLMESTAAQAQAAGLRAIVCETQTTNTPAIAAYRKLGFRLEGVDLSYYSNEDEVKGEIAVFMKRRL